GVRAGRERKPTAAHGAGEREHRAGARGGDGAFRERAYFSFGDFGCKRKQAIERLERRVDFFAECGGEARRERSRARNRDLLTEDRPYRELEPVERAGHAQARVAGRELSERERHVRRVAGQI